MSRSTSSRNLSTPKNETTPKNATTHGYTMLMIRVEEGDLSEVKLALEKYPEETVNDQNKHGQTALSLAARNGTYEIAEYLISQGADVNLANKTGQTPLFIACSYNHLELVNLLLYHGSNVNVADSRGWTPLMSACQNSNVALVELLLLYKADIRPIDRFGKTAKERTKDKRILRILNEMERRIEMLEEAAKYQTPHKRTSRSHSRGSATKRSQEEEEEMGENPGKIGKEEDQYDNRSLNSTIRTSSQFVTDMDIYNMHKRAGYYKYFKPGDPRNLYAASATSLKRRKDRSFESLLDKSAKTNISNLKSPFGNDLFTSTSRGRPLTNRGDNSRLNDSKSSIPRNGEKKRANSRDLGSAKSLKGLGSPILNQISKSFMDNMNNFNKVKAEVDAILKGSEQIPTFSKSAGYPKSEVDSIVKTVLKRGKLMEDYDSSDDDENDDVLNEQLQNMFRRFVKKLAKRMQRKLDNKVEKSVEKQRKENETIPEELLQQIIEMNGKELEEKTIDKFKSLIVELEDELSLGSNLPKALQEGTETLTNRIAALAQHNLYQGMVGKKENTGFECLTPEKAGLYVSPVLKNFFKEESPKEEAILLEVFENREINKAKEELRNKLNELFTILEDVSVNSEGDENIDLIKNFKSEALKSLNKLRVGLLQELLIKSSVGSDKDEVNSQGLAKEEKKGTDENSEENQTGDLKKEINDKLTELFELLEEAIVNKTEEEKTQFISSFRSETNKVFSQLKAKLLPDLLLKSTNSNPSSSSEAHLHHEKAEVQPEDIKEEIQKEVVRIIDLTSAENNETNDMTSKLKKELYNKMDEIFDIIDKILPEKTESEKEQFLKDFRAEALKALNKLRSNLLHSLLLRSPGSNTNEKERENCDGFSVDLQKKKSTNTAEIKKHLEIPGQHQTSTRYNSSAYESVDLQEAPLSFLAQPHVKGNDRDAVQINILQASIESNIKQLNNLPSIGDENNENTVNKNILIPHHQESLKSLNELGLESDTTACKTEETIIPTTTTFPSEILKRHSLELETKRGEIFVNEFNGEETERARGEEKAACDKRNNEAGDNGKNVEELRTDMEKNSNEDMNAEKVEQIEKSKEIIESAEANKNEQKESENKNEKEGIKGRDFNMIVRVEYAGEMFDDEDDLSATKINDNNAVRNYYSGDLESVTATDNSAKEEKSSEVVFTLSDDQEDENNKETSATIKEGIAPIVSHVSKITTKVQSRNAGELESASSKTSDSDDSNDADVKVASGKKTKENERNIQNTEFENIQNTNKDENLQEAKDRLQTGSIESKDKEDLENLEFSAHSQNQGQKDSDDYDQESIARKEFMRRFDTYESNKENTEVIYYDTEEDFRDEERKRMYTESSFFRRGGVEELIERVGGIVDEVQTVSSEVIYKFEDGSSNRPSDLSEIASRRNGAGREPNILERTETRESEVLYRFDEDQSESKSAQRKYQKIDIIEDQEDLEEKSLDKMGGYFIHHKEGEIREIKKERTPRYGNEIENERSVVMDEALSQSQNKNFHMSFGSEEERIKEMRMQAKYHYQTERYEESDANKENNSKLANKIYTNESIYGRNNANLKPEGMEKSTFGRQGMTQTIKTLGSSLRFSIPIPAPSRTVRRIIKMRIDEIPFCENFHYPGQSKKYRSHSIGIPRRTTYKETSIWSEEISVVLPKDY